MRDLTHPVLPEASAQLIPQLVELLGCEVPHFPDISWMVGGLTQHPVLLGAPTGQGPGPRGQGRGLACWTSMASS